MGLDVLFWIVVLTWLAKRGAEDVTYALKGQTPPRHRERMERIKRGQSQTRYGLRGWLDDATEDFLRANTQWRRARAAQRAAARLEVPLDDLADAVRENPVAPAAEPVPDERPGTPVGELEPFDRLMVGPPIPSRPDPRPDARIIQFPTVKLIEKEITMANSEVTGLSTAIAFANHASNAHTEFATTGTEGYVGALERAGNSGQVITTAREAMEASGVAADKWAAHREELEKQQNLKEGYQSNPDAGDKDFLVNE